MLGCANLQKSLEYYRENLGFEVVKTNREWQPDKELNWVFLRRDKVELMLNQNEREPGRVQLYFTVDDVLVEHERIGAQEAVEETFYAQREFWLCDPDGIGLGFGQKTPTT